MGGSEDEKKNYRFWKIDLNIKCRFWDLLKIRTTSTNVDTR